MVPAGFVFLEALPLTPNGKLDRKALPVPEREHQVSGAYVAPQSELEQQLAAVWQEVLGVDKAGVDDNFFDLGGNSLLVTQVHARIKPLFAREVRVVDLFRFPTIRALCAHLGRPEVLTAWMDPAVTDENDPSAVDAALDMYDARNGPPYSPEFQARYRAAQVARNERITD